ncbi:Rap/ran-GAP [Carpediemonas membranifera]|uniref:Rap/ran-GAP n=1 Tax=Carpediemonas membranifera TaxID=201153 RepID=A0A8J6E119_9EUKA|nr:Rap/ran-GAP [Carpediemonas membranifera]|eukprot:KAG9392546.1 Rap/ran-GAP [Carpediemonas membranifera]
MAMEVKSGWKREIVASDSAVSGIDEWHRDCRILEDPDHIAKPYHLNFREFQHHNFIAFLPKSSDGLANPVVASVSVSETPSPSQSPDGSFDSIPDAADSAPGTPRQYNILLRDSSSTKMLHMPETAVPVPPFRRLFTKRPTIKSIVAAALGPSHALGDTDLSTAAWRILPASPTVVDQLSAYEVMLREQHRSHTVGVLLQLPGQTTEEEMFSNQEITPEFARFLATLGRMVDLHGWNDYAGGLNTTKCYTGEQSVFINHKGHKVMYHVANMLPYSKSDPQQIERKRFVGNDHVVVVFQDGKGDMPFGTSTIRTNMTMAYVVIRRAKPHDSDSDSTLESSHEPEYTMDVVTMRCVPPTAPELSESNRFILSDPRAAELVRTKLVNLSNAVWSQGVLAEKLQKMRAVNLAKVDVRR